MLQRALTALTLLALVGGQLLAGDPDVLRVYYGTKNNSGSKGIYTGTMNLRTGELSQPKLATVAENAGFVAISQGGRVLYAAESGKSGQRIVAYRIDAESGKLTKLNSQESGGMNPCHVSVGPKNRYVVYANYTGGSCGMMPLAEDGSLQPRSSFFQHKGGSGVNARRQGEPHPHSANTDPSGNFVAVADLGQDRVRMYRVEGTAKMNVNDPPAGVSPAGGGPRHTTFHPSGRYLYANNELTSSVTVFALSPTTGQLSPKQTISTLPRGFSGNNSTAEILVHPSGKFLYCSNRGHNSVAEFSIDRESGKLKSLGQMRSGGKTPRNFRITPDGNYIVVANHGSNDVFVLKVDTQSGRLGPPGSKIAVPHCICVRFVPQDA